jgi:hypothetical protein
MKFELHWPCRGINATLHHSDQCDFVSSSGEKQQALHMPRKMKRKRHRDRERGDAAMRGKRQASSSATAPSVEAPPSLFFSPWQLNPPHSPNVHRASSSPPVL